MFGNCIDWTSIKESMVGAKMTNITLFEQISLSREYKLSSYPHKLEIQEHKFFQVSSYLYLPYIKESTE